MRIEISQDGDSHVFPYSCCWCSRIIKVENRSMVVLVAKEKCYIFCTKCHDLTLKGFAFNRVGFLSLYIGATSRFDKISAWVHQIHHNCRSQISTQLLNGWCNARYIYRNTIMQDRVIKRYSCFLPTIFVPFIGKLSHANNNFKVIVNRCSRSLLTKREYNLFLASIIETN